MKLAEYRLTISTSSEHRSRKKLHVVIWDRVGELRRAAKEHSTETKYFWRQAAGAYVGVRGKYQFGEIHLWTKWIGAGYFAHELQHFMDDYATATEKLPLDFDANERMAHLAGVLTAEFWTKFYERFEIANA